MLPQELGGLHFYRASLVSVVKNPLANQCRTHGLNIVTGKIPWRRKWQPTPVFLLGKSHGQRILVGYSPWGLKRVRHDLAAKQQHFYNQRKNEEGEKATFFLCKDVEGKWGSKRWSHPRTWVNFWNGPPSDGP